MKPSSYWACRHAGALSGARTAPGRANRGPKLGIDDLIMWEYHGTIMDDFFFN